MPNTIFPDSLTDAHLTMATNRVGASNLKFAKKNFVRWEGSTSTNVSVGVADGQIQIIPEKPLHAPGTPLVVDKRSSVVIQAPYYPHTTTVYASDVQNLRPIPGSDQSHDQTVAQEVMSRTAQMTENYDMTYEWLHINALKGLVQNLDNTFKLDFNKQFGVTRQNITFAFTNTAGELMKKCEELKQLVSKNMGGGALDYVEVQVGTTFWNALIAHTDAIEAYKRYQESQALRGGFDGRLLLNGVAFELENRSFNNVDFVGSTEGLAYPVGMGTFKGVYCPADMTDYANTLGQKYYVSTEDLKHGKGVEIHMETRPLIWCRHLPALVDVAMS